MKIPDTVALCAAEIKGRYAKTAGKHVHFTVKYQPLKGQVKERKNTRVPTLAAVLQLMTLRLCMSFVGRAWLKISGALGIQQEPNDLEPDKFLSWHFGSSESEHASTELKHAGHECLFFLMLWEGLSWLLSFSSKVKQGTTEASGRTSALPWCYRLLTALSH